jgi:hypothetical protein
MARMKLKNKDGSWQDVLALTGPAGKDADVTQENVTKALGYTPAKQEDVTSLFEEKANKADIPAPYTLPTASADVKGGVKVGSGLQMDGDVLGVVPEDTFEQIVFVEIDEPVKSVKMDGFELKEMIMTVFIPQAEVANTLACNVYAGNDAPYFSVANAQSTSGGKYTKAFCSSKNNILRIQTGQPSPKETDSTNHGAIGLFNVGDNAYIYRVQPYMGSSKDFPVGTWIRIDGVRANA